MSLIPLGFWAASGGGAAGAFDLLETQILASSASSVTFTGLGAYSDYKHLQIRAVVKSDRSSGLEQMLFRFNGDSGTNYSRHSMGGNTEDVSSFGASSQTAGFIGRVSDTLTGTNAFGPFVWDILDFSSSTKNTTTRALSGTIGGGVGQIFLQSAAYLNTNSITSLEIFPEFGPNLLSGSRFSLYGVK